MEKYSIEPYKDKDEVSDFRKEEAYLRAKKKFLPLLCGKKLRVTKHFFVLSLISGFNNF